MVKMKKGVVFTFALTLLALVLLSLAMLVNNTFIDSEERSQLLIVGDRLNNLDNSLQKTIRGVFNSKSGINVIFGGTSIIINQTLPSQDPNAFSNEMDNLKSYVESYFDNINISKDNIDDLSFLVLPARLNYTYKNPNLDKIVINHDTTKLSAYEFYIYREDKNGTIDFASFTPGSFPITLIVEGGGGYMDTETQSVDINSLVEINVIYHPKEVSIDLNSNSVTIEKDFSQEIVSKNKISFKGDVSPSVFIPEVIEMNFTGFGITKRGGVKLY